MPASVDTHLVIAIGGFPPPVTGQSKNLDLIAEDIATYPGVFLLRRTVAGGALGKTLHTHLRKFRRVIRAGLTILWNFSRYSRRTVYLVSDGGWGLIYTVGLAWMGRALGYRIILQHRTFQYVRRTSRLAALADRALTGGFHVFLCDAMALQYRTRYKSNTPYLVVGNLSQYGEFLGAPSPTPRAADEPIRVGLLSNLFLTKGLDTFLEVARAAREKNLSVRFFLAGPVPAADSQTLIDSAISDLGSTLEVRGPLYGADKAAFYADLDIFMFPTRYALEAQPNVVLEAMCAGCAIISTDRGCVADDIADAGAVIPAEQQADHLLYLNHIEQFIDNRSRLERARARAHELAQKGILRDRENYTEFLRNF